MTLLELLSKYFTENKNTSLKIQITFGAFVEWDRMKTIWFNTTTKFAKWFSLLHNIFVKKKTLDIALNIKVGKEH